MLFKVFAAVAVFSSAAVVEASPTPSLAREANLEEIAEFTERATPLAQLITKCTVPNTVALTFDDGPEQYIHVCIPILPYLASELTNCLWCIEYLKASDQCRWEGHIFLERQQL
jgi:hypothetical protein